MVELGKNKLETMLEGYDGFIPKKHLSCGSWLSWKIALVSLKLYDSKDRHKCRPLGEVLTANLEQYKMETMLEQYKSFILAKNVCF